MWRRCQSYWLCWCLKINQFEDTRTSDHEAVLCRFSVERLSEWRAHRRGRLFTRKNYCNFEARCSGTCWRGVFDSADPLNSSQELLCRLFNQAFPLTLIKSRIINGLRVFARNMRCLHYIRKFYSPNITYLNVKSNKCSQENLL